ncbi:MAG TPA: sulfite exporter TauE/SafE family protein [Chloroflexi bacterium]|nr:sulfite exporter TauE/SafE family protein [Chloroflexota bacterium]
MFFLLITLILLLAFIFSMLGLGGAMVYNPLMVWFGYDFKEVVVSTGLLLNGLTALSAAWVYYRNKMIDFSIGLPLTVAASLGAPVGAYFTRFVPTTTLLWIFAIVVIFAAVRMMLTSGQVEPESVRGTAMQRAALGTAVGLGVGALAGMLGIGGGFLFVPLLIFLGYPTKTAAATTALAVVFSSFTGLAGHLAVGHFDWPLMLAASVAVVIGSQAGARVMTARMKSRQLKQMFGIVLLFVAAKLITGLL